MGLSRWCTFTLMFIGQRICLEFQTSRQSMRPFQSPLRTTLKLFIFSTLACKPVCFLPLSAASCLTPSKHSSFLPCNWNFPFHKKAKRSDLYGGVVISLTCRLYNKVKYVKRVEFLWEHVRRKEMDLPKFVYDHDEKLEFCPVMESDLENDYLRVFSPSPSLNSGVSTYSMRCFA